MTTSVRPSSAMDARIRARRARVRAESVRRRQRRTWSLFVLLLLVAGVAVVLRSPLFEVGNLQVRGVAGSRGATVRHAAAIDPRAHVLTVPLDEAEARVERLAWVADARVHRLPPSSVAIDIVPRVPLLTLRANGASWKVDDEAVLVDGGRVADAPVIRGSGLELPAPGKPIAAPGIRNAIETHVGLPSWLRQRVVAYEVGGPRDLQLRVTMPAASDEEPETVLVRFGAARDIALKAEVIRVLLPEAVERDGDLDVRAPANPVVVPSAAVRAEQSQSDDG